MLGLFTANFEKAAYICTSFRSEELFLNLAAIDIEFILEQEGAEKNRRHDIQSADCARIFPDETTKDSLRTESLSLVSYTILPKVLGHPLLMKGLTTLVISMSTNLNV